MLFIFVICNRGKVPFDTSSVLSCCHTPEPFLWIMVSSCPVVSFQYVFRSMFYFVLICVLCLARCLASALLFPFLYLHVHFPLFETPLNNTKSRSLVSALVALLVTLAFHSSLVSVSLVSRSGISAVFCLSLIHEFCATFGCVHSVSSHRRVVVFFCPVPQLSSPFHLT